MPPNDTKINFSGCSDNFGGKKCTKCGQRWQPYYRKFCGSEKVRCRYFGIPHLGNYFCQNFRESVSQSQREPLKLRREASDLGSEVWNLRDDCSSAISSLEHSHHHHPPNHSLCLYNPSARDSSENMDRGPCAAHYYHVHSYSADTEAATTRSCHSHTMQSSGACSPLSGDHREMVFSTIAASSTPPSRHSHCVEEDEHLEMSNSLYQGETFLLNDKQYFI